jgi:hypothetical protein
MAREVGFITVALSVSLAPPSVVISLILTALVAAGVFEILAVE